MKIPKYIQIIGKTYKVELHKKLLEKEGLYGCVDFDTHIIKLQSINDSICRSEIEHTLLHEIVHTLFRELGKDKLVTDESFTDIFASVLLQIVKQL